MRCKSLIDHRKILCATVWHCDNCGIIISWAWWLLCVLHVSVKENILSYINTLFSPSIKHYLIIWTIGKPLDVFIKCFRVKAQILTYSVGESRTGRSGYSILVQFSQLSLQAAWQPPPPPLRLTNCHITVRGQTANSSNRIKLIKDWESSTRIGWLNSSF